MAKQIVINLSDEDYKELLKQYEQLKKINLDKNSESASLSSYLQKIIESIIRTNRKIDFNSIMNKKLIDFFEKIKDFSSFSDLKEMFESYSKKEEKKPNNSDEEKYKS